MSDTFIRGGPLITKGRKISKVPWGTQAAVFPEKDEEWEKFSRMYIPEFIARTVENGYDKSIGKWEEAYKAWLDKIKQRAPGGAAPGPSYTSDGADMSDYLNLTAYRMLKDRAVGEGYEVIELSPEEMLEKFGYASDRSERDRGSAGNYKGWEENYKERDEEGDEIVRKVIYVDREAKELPLILAHEYMGKKYTASGRAHAYHEGEVQSDAKKLLNDLYKNIGKYSVN